MNYFLSVNCSKYIFSSFVVFWKLTAFLVMSEIIRLSIIILRNIRIFFILYFPFISADRLSGLLGVAWNSEVKLLFFYELLFLFYKCFFFRKILFLVIFGDLYAILYFNCNFRGWLFQLGYQVSIWRNSSHTYICYRHGNVVRGF